MHRDGGRLELQDGRDADCQSSVRTGAVVPDALYLADWGSFKLARFREIGVADAFWLSRVPASVSLTDTDGHRWDEGTDLLEHVADNAVVDIAVTVGVQQRLPSRLVVVLAPQEVVNQRR